MTTAAYQGWARLELMGHRTRIGFVSEVEMYGGKMLQIDLPTTDGQHVTEFYGVTSIYALTPCSEDVARNVAKSYGDPRPVRPVDYRLEDKRPDASNLAQNLGEYGPEDDDDVEPF